MSSASKIFRAEDIEIDGSLASVRRGGEERHLRHQAFDVLLYLLHQRHKVVTKDELIEAVWGDTSVTDNALVQCIAEIRKALGDDPHHPRFVRTFSKAGYRFIAEVEEKLVSVPVSHEEIFPAVAGDHSTAAPREVTSGLDLLRHGELTDAHASLTTPSNDRAHAHTPSTPPGEDNTSPDGGHNNDETAAAEAHSADSGSPAHAIRLTYNDITGTGWRHDAVIFGAACVLVALLALGIAFGVRSAARRHASEMTLPQVPGKRALAVMYFDDHSNRQDLNWLREGLADMLITDMARSERLTVLSRQQLYLLLERIGHSNGDSIRLDEALDIARRTHADTVLLGSFSGFGEEIRIDAQLYSVSTGQLVAADQLVVHSPAEILTQIDTLALKLESHLGTRGHNANTSVAEVMTDNLEAYRYYSLGVEKAQTFENAQAIQLLQKAVELDPKFAMAFARIGYAYAVTDFVPDAGRPYLEKALQLSAPLSEKDKLSIRAWYAISKSDYGEAIRIFRQIIEQYPQETEAYWRLARLLQGEERAEEGIAVLKQGLSVDPDAKELYNTLGVNYLALERYPEAIAAHERYVELAPREPNAHDSHAMSLQQSGRYDEAIAEYNAALSLQPEFEPAIVHLGDVYFQQGRYRDAIRQYERYINVTHLDSAKSVGYGNIAQIYLRVGDLRRAHQASINEMRLGKGAPWSSFLVALAKGDRTRVQELRNMLMQSASFGERGARENTRVVKYFIGFGELRNGDPAKAIADFSEAVRHLPPTSGIDSYEDCLANAYLETGRFDDAIREYERILRMNPNYPLAQYHLAKAYEGKGDREKARTASQQFLKSWARADSDIPEIRLAKRVM